MPVDWMDRPRLPKEVRQKGGKADECQISPFLMQRRREIRPMCGRGVSQFPDDMPQVPQMRRTFLTLGQKASIDSCSTERFSIVTHHIHLKPTLLSLSPIIILRTGHVGSSVQGPAVGERCGNQREAQRMGRYAAKVAISMRRGHHYVVP
jgi:hypothetical protein